MVELAHELPTRSVLDVNPWAIEGPDEQKAVLAMRASALKGSEAFTQANEELRLVAGRLGLIPTVTYEDLVFINPVEDGPYVMSTEPDAAEQEGFFYRTHSVIEGHLAKAIDSIAAGDPETGPDSIALSNSEFADLYRKLRTGSFDSFSRYFDGLNGYPGASGRFTASIPILDLLAHGGLNIREEERARMITDIDRGLYPRHQSGQLRDLLLNDERIADISLDTRRRATLLLNRFWSLHDNSVDKYIPEGEPGSGGEENPHALRGTKNVPLERLVTEAPLEPAAV